MPVRAVIFDWGGTLTPWHSVDQDVLWRGIFGRHYPAGRAAELAVAAQAAELELWQLAEQRQRSSSLADVAIRAGFSPAPELWASYFDAWEPHTYTDPEVAPLWRRLRQDGIRIGVLSNTMWPGTAHQRIFHRDGVADLIDGAVYTSEIGWTKPHPEAFAAARAAVGVEDPASCVFVGDRPFDDIHGATQAGMRAVLIRGSDVPGYAAARPDAVISRLSELPGRLAAWR